MAIRGLEHRNVRPDALEAHHTVNPTALDQAFALQLESKLDKERCGGGEVVDHDAHVIHALDRHAFNGRPHPEPTSRSPSSELYQQVVDINPPAQPRRVSAICRLL